MLCWPPFFHFSQSDYITSSATFLLIMQPVDRCVLKSNIDIQRPSNLQQLRSTNEHVSTTQHRAFRHRSPTHRRPRRPHRPQPPLFPSRRRSSTAPTPILSTTLIFHQEEIPHPHCHNTNHSPPHRRPPRRHKNRPLKMSTRATSGLPNHYHYIHVAPFHGRPNDYNNDSADDAHEDGAV